MDPFRQCKEYLVKSRARVKIPLDRRKYVSQKHMFLQVGLNHLLVVFPINEKNHFTVIECSNSHFSSAMVHR